MSKIKTITTEEGIELSRQIIQDNSNFTMYFDDKVEVISHLIDKSKITAKILLKLIREMDRVNVIVVSQKTIAEWFDISIPTVKRSVKLLRDMHLIETFMVGTMPAIAINANLAWKSDANGKKYAKCKAEIIFSKADQLKMDARKQRFNSVFA